MNESVWLLSLPSDEARHLSAELGIPVEVAQILINRKVCDVEAAHQYLYGTLDDLHDPFLMAGMREAVGRLKKAASSGEKILIIGDYDVDGILSIVILTKALKTLGADVDYYIPARLKEGYGIKEKHMDIVREKLASLVVSVDCGIKAVKFARMAKEKGVDFIITDHHLPGPVLPEALATLNPVVENSGYPDKNLAGIGVVFKLIQALLQDTEDLSVLYHYLKLVAIGTIADIGKLRGENRLFVKFGLSELENVSNKGLLTLMDSCGLNGKNVSVGDVGFRIGPRINAAGRMGLADMAVNLFMTDATQECDELVFQMNRLNKERQTIEEKIFNQAFRWIRKKSLDSRYKILILGCEEWHRGVIGIVASKLKDYFHRPLILFTYENGRAYGSGRSIREFSLIKCLEENKDFLFNYGGHAQAVGCELSLNNMRPFKKAVSEFASTLISDEDLKRKLVIDTKINFSDINAAFLEHVSLLSPFGMGNPRPIFLTENAEVIAEPRKIKGRHSKLFVRNDGRSFEALGWGREDWAENIRRGDKVDLVYSIQSSEYLGEPKLSLILEDIKKNPDY